ncbi:hypothetical protein ALQ16_202067 [Pseudomonas syringae pv. actinidiae]|uniref:Permease component n=1 Tax=Pseudomonas syringae pv. actinidiae TaxID=103796 RepID=A0AAN4Q457_PSESF|nr:hypothetical protein ALQ16_202067 [Pseudomonas syringae pv. actinidiae]GBH16946.1 permease component [Pseudomonas syringae pv. actinidiae]
MAALSASKLVWLAIDWITIVTRWISSLRWLSASISSRLPTARWLNRCMRSMDSFSALLPDSLRWRASLAATSACWLNCAVCCSVAIICSALLTTCSAAPSCDCTLPASCPTENAT